MAKRESIKREKTVSLTRGLFAKHLEGTFGVGEPQDYAGFVAAHPDITEVLMVKHANMPYWIVDDADLRRQMSGGISLTNLAIVAGGVGVLWWLARR